jgi:hypothetical protein
MHKVKFWIDFVLTPDDSSVEQWFWFSVEMPDDEYEKLYQVWYDNNCTLNSWESDWKGHEDMFDKLNSAAYHALNELLKEQRPEFADPIDVYWEISQETEKAF